MDIAKDFCRHSKLWLYCGAKVDFVDIDRQTYNLCPKALKAKLIQAKAQDRLPKIVAAVHYQWRTITMVSKAID